MKMDRPVTARELLQEASASSNRQLAGTSGVTLGTLLLEDGEPLAAARAFDKASERLTGSDALKARRAAASAYKSAGRNDIAEENIEPIELRIKQDFSNLELVNQELEQQNRV